MKVFSPASEIFLPGNPLVRSSEVKSGSGPEVIEAGRPGAANPTLRPDQPTNWPTWKLQNCSSTGSRRWWARTQVKWRRIMSAIFVYCEETGGKLVNKENMGLHWLLFNSWQLLIFDWSQKRKPFFCNFPIVVHITRHMVVLKNDFIGKNWFPLFLTSNNTQLCWDFYKTWIHPLGFTYWNLIIAKI